MNLFFIDNLDIETAGALPAWFTAISGAWEVVADAGAYSSPNDLQDLYASDGQKVLIKGGSGVAIPANADMILTYVTKTITGSTGLQPILRSDAASANYYVWLLSESGGYLYFQLYKCVSGSLNTVGSNTNTGVSWTSGDFYSVKVSAIGTTISAKVWQAGTSEPGSYQATQTDGSVTAAGYAGFYNQGTASGAAVDNIALYGNASLAAGSISSSGITGTTATLTAGAASGGTSPYTYQWYRSTTSGFVPQTSNLVSGATSLVLNDTGLSPSTEYYYVQIASDSAGNIAWSNQASITTGAGSATDFSFTPSLLNTTPSTPTGNYTITPNGTPSSSISIALTDGGAGGTFSHSTLTFTTSAAQTFTYTPPSGSAGDTITLTATASGGFTASHTASCAVNAADGAGTAYATYVGATTVQLSATDATGGSGSFTFQWYRSITSGVAGTAISGATSESVVDTGASPSTTYFYSLAYTDTSGGAVVYSPQVSVTTLAASAEEVIGGIGDSIMAGAYSSVETPFNAMIDQLNFKLNTKQWRGVNEAVSGTTSTNWLSGGSYLPGAVTAFAAAGVTRIVLMLGTNDSKSDVATPAATYFSNISAIVAYCFANISTLRTVHLCTSPFQSDTVASGGDLTVGNCGRLLAYAAQLGAIANGSTIFLAYPLDSYNHFQRNPNLLRDGVHPTDEGDQTMGAIWAEGVIKALSPSTSSTLAGYSRGRVANG